MSDEVSDTPTCRLEDTGTGPSTCTRTHAHTHSHTHTHTFRSVVSTPGSPQGRFPVMGGRLPFLGTGKPRGRACPRGWGRPGSLTCSHESLCFFQSHKIETGVQ